MRNSIFTRYVALELVSFFVVVVTIITVVLVLAVVAGEAVRMNLGLMPTLRLLPFVLPTALAYAVPTAFLFAVCLVYGRMSADNEVVAAKSLGISPVVLIAPGLLIAFVLSLAGVALHDFANSWGTAGVQRVIVQSLEEVAYGMLRSQRAFANPRFSIVVKGVDGKRLIRPTMNFQANNDLPALTVTAAEAELRSDLSRDMMTLILTDCEIEMPPNVRTVLPGQTTKEFPLTYFSAKEIRAGSPGQMPMRKIHGEITLQLARIHELEQSLAAAAAMALVTGDLDELYEENWRARRRQLAEANSRLYRLRIEPSRRWACGFSALCFALCGAPWAILLKKADVMTRFGLLFGGILVCYYPLLIGCLDRVKGGAMPPYVVWTPNVILALVGFALMKRVIRY